MLKYDISYSLPQHHFIDFAFYIDNITPGELFIQLPSWRPGRYEIGNFAQNVQHVQVFNTLMQPIPFEKISKDCWKIEAGKEENIVVRYRYYAAVLNAGSSYLDATQLYLNPVNCFMYVVGRMHEPIQLQFILPASYHIATQLPKLTKHTLLADSFDHLADSPLIASAAMKHFRYESGNTHFHLWFQGEVVADEKRILEDFSQFTREQIHLFGDCECKEYHFLMQMMPEPFHHGVEHMSSSVNALGPGTALMQDTIYNDFLGLCSHELFHLWNVKRIRPQAMLPYDFTKENYCSLGYIYEGITTYYGDLILLRSGVYSLNQYFSEVNVQLNKHFHNYGRFHQSLADSSTDTWLDGYVPGIPERKVNIYTEGMLCALILDACIIEQTDAEYRLDACMRTLYNDFYKNGLGYTEEDVKIILEQITGHRYDWFFQELIHGTGRIEQHLNRCLQYIGLCVEREPSKSLQYLYGIKTENRNGNFSILGIAPDSSAYTSGLAKGDVLKAINGNTFTDSPEDHEALSASDTAVLSILRNGNTEEFVLKEKGVFYADYRLKELENPTQKEKRNFIYWKSSSEKAGKFL